MDGVRGHRAWKLLLLSAFRPLTSLAVLKVVDRYLSVIVAVVVIAGTVACSEYLIAIPVLGIMGIGGLAWLYELLVKLERRWDRALEARRYRKLREVTP
jgi:hypothetical protein